MALLKFISLSVGSLMLLQGAYSDESKSHPSATPTDCTQAIDAARSAVGLTSFTKQTEKLIKTNTGDSEDEALVEICKILQQEPYNEASQATPPEGTVAYLAQDTNDCKAPVEAWKKGFEKLSSITGTVPQYKKAGTASTLAIDQTGVAPYDSQEAVNFAALYSGLAKDVECALMTCPKKNVTVPTTQDLPYFKGMVCIVSPKALQDNTAPWKDEEFKKIAEVLGAKASPSSATAAAPTLLALAAAALGVALI